MGKVTTGREVLSAHALRDWVREAMTLLTLARPVIDRANVFPVADSDTGTNMCLTLGQGSADVDALPAGADVESVLAALAHGALLGARGNSGVILSEYLRGFAAGARGAAGGPAAATIVAALHEGARCAYDAVGHPREGTILTAATGAAGAAGAALGAGEDLAGVLRAARSGADGALRRSAEDLDVLRAAGVLDAGAYGLVLVLDALGRALAPTVPMSDLPGSMSSMTVLSTLSVEPIEPGGHAPGDVPPPRDSLHDAGLDGEFEVMYVLEVTSDEPDETLASIAGLLRSALREIGDSVAVVGGPTSRDLDSPVRGLWQVHVHTDRPLDALRVDALRVGRRWTQRQVVVRSLAQQVSRAVGGDGLPSGRQGTGVVACTTSPGLVPELARAGAVVVLRGSVPVASADVQRAVEETRAEEVVLLPADRDTVDAARAWASLGSAPAALHVVGSASDLHVVAAMAQWATVAPGSTSREVAASMVAAVEALRVVEVLAADAASATAALGELLGSGHASVLTVLADELVPAGVVDELAREAARLAPTLDVVVLSSGRYCANLLLGVE